MATPTIPASTMSGCLCRMASSSVGATWLPFTLIRSYSNCQSKSYIFLGIIVRYLFAIHDIPLSFLINISYVPSWEPPISSMSIASSFCILVVTNAAAWATDPDISNGTSIDNLTWMTGASHFALIACMEFSHGLGCWGSVYIVAGNCSEPIEWYNELASYLPTSCLDDIYVLS